MYLIYWLINETQTKSYVGYTNNIKNRIKKHKAGDVRSTKNFGNFTCVILEKINSLEEAVIREKYWKSSAGRKKLKKYFIEIKNHGPFV